MSGPAGRSGEDKQWQWADAKIVDADTVEVSNAKIKDPQAVRYNWSSNPQGTLYSTAYLPAYPFRTDDWEGTTAKSVTP